jgi:RNA polymerase I-specific transcription initiation factor RRN3
MVSLISTERANGVMAPLMSGSLKRKHTADTDSADDSPGIQNKKRRVTFDPAVDIHILPDVNEKSLELVGEEVRRALEKHAAGENGTYDYIRSLFSAKPTSPDAPLSSLLEKYVIALTNTVTLLDHKCSGLVHALIDSSWVARNEHFHRSYRTLLRSLLAVHPGYTSAVLHMLVDMFLELPSPSQRQQDDPPVQRSTLLARVHDLLGHLVRHITMTSTQLGPIIASTFPFPTESAKVHVAYIRNILRIADYCPELKGQIYSVITDKLVKIDVQIQVDMEELEDDIEERLVEDAIENAEAEEEDVSDDESVSSDESLDEEDRRLKELKESVTKLDAIMDVLFSYYDSVFREGDSDDTYDVFQNLLAQFATIILPTYRSRHTQFLLFHFSQTSDDLIERFAGCCSHLAFDHALPQILRTHISGGVVRDVFDLLCHHLEALRASHESTCKGPDLRRYGTYYAIAQALLYTFCFRWRDLIVTEHGRPPSDEEVLYQEGDFTWHGKTQEILRRNIFSKLNPLKICNTNIVNQFAGMAHHLRFLYVFPLIETNKRIRLSRSLGNAYMEGVGARETALTMKKGEGSFLLEPYFPFDPYLLPKSKRWLEGQYVEWKPVPGMPPPTQEEDEDDEEEEEDDDEEDDVSDDSDSNVQPGDIDSAEEDFQEDTEGSSPR